MEVPEQDDSTDPWQCVTWEGARKARLRSQLSATPAQRLAWVEEALELAYHSGALKRLRDEQSRECLRKLKS